MSEPIAMTQGEKESQAVSVSGHSLSAGQMLRAAREASGLHIAALAVSMKVPVKKLEALEADRFDLLPDAVFVRALAASVCRTLKIEPTEILVRLPQTLVPRLDTDARSINTPFHSPGHAPVWTLSTALKSPVFLVVLLLVIGALFIVFFPEKSSTEDLSPAPSSVVAPVVSEERPAVGVAPAMPPASAASAVVVPLASNVPAQAISSTISAETPRATPGVISFRQRGPSWVEVTDTKGVVQLRKTLVLGESITVSGDLPMSVVVGRADVTDVEVRGKPYSLLEITKDNVARFEVK